MAEGTVDCGIIYASDAYSAKLTVAAEATADMCGQVIYPAAILNTSTQQDAAAAFLQYLQSTETSAEFEKVLFTPPGQVILYPFSLIGQGALRALPTSHSYHRSIRVSTPVDRCY